MAHAHHDDHTGHANDPHAWTLDGDHNALTFHLCVHTTVATERSIILADARKKLKEMHIAHATIQLEMPANEYAFEHH